MYLNSRNIQEQTMKTKPQTFYLSWLASLPLMGMAFLPIYAHADDDSDHASFSESDMPHRFEHHEFRESMPDRAHFVGDDHFRDDHAELAGRFDHPDHDRTYRSDESQWIRSHDQAEDGADRINPDEGNMVGFSDDRPADWALGYDTDGITPNEDATFGLPDESVNNGLDEDGARLVNLDGDNMAGFSDDQPTDRDHRYRDEDRDRDSSYTFYLPN
jgi:hypothetical protein